MNHKPLFSVCCIARNEAKTLPRLVASLKEFQARGGAIVIVDTGSTDGTPEIARNLGCVVYEVGTTFLNVIDENTAKEINAKFIMEGETPILKEGDKVFDFASARNYAASLCPTDWVSMPDCDEIFTKFDIDKIEDAINAGAQQLEYEFVFAHDENGNPIIKFKHSKFYNRTVQKWVCIIHEVLSGDAVRTYLDESVIKLEHWQNPETNRGGYLTGLALDCFMNPENDRNAHYFARELMYHGRYKSAIEQFKRHMEMNGWPTERSQSAIYIGECLKFLGRIDEAFGWYIKAFDIEPNRREPLMKLAEYYYQINRPQQAVAYCEAALTIQGGSFYSNYQPYYEHLPHEILYWGYWQIGNKEKSKEHFEKALGFVPDHPKYLADKSFYISDSTKEPVVIPDENLPTIDIIIPQLGRTEGLKKCIESIKNLNYPQDKITVRVMEDEELTVPVKLKLGVESTSGNWIVFGANDIEFTPDSIKIAVSECLMNGRPFCAFNTGDVYPDEGNICEHFMIRRNFIPEIGGEIFDTDFHHIGVDNLLWAKLKKLGVAYRNSEAIVHHYHFSRALDQASAMDGVYQKGWSRVNEDRELLNKKLAEL